MRNWLLLSSLIIILLSCQRDVDPTPNPDPPPTPTHRDTLNGWQKIETNLPDEFPDIAFITPAVGFLAGGKATYKTADSGKTWVVEPTITSRPVTINFLNNQYAFAVGHPNMAFTRNGGASWQVKNAPAAIDVAFVTPSTGYIIGNSVYKTVDTGNTWQPVGNRWGIPSSTIFFINEQQGWYAVSDTIYQTLNGGTNWTGKKIGAGRIQTVFFSDPLNGWLTADTSVYRTTNGGTTWIKSSVGAVTVDVQFLNTQVGYVSVYDGVFKTTDSGVTWVRSLTAPLSPFPELIFLDENTGWVTGSGNIIYRWKK